MSLKISPKLLTISPQIIYTCPVGMDATIHGLVISNNTNEANTFSLSIFQNSTTSSFSLATYYSVDSRTSFSWSRPINLQSGDYISCSSNGNLTIAASIYESETTIQGFTTKGEWNSGTTYSLNDVVSYNNVAYAAIQTSTNKTPSTETSYWMVLAESTAGYTGSIGYTGSAGETISGIPQNSQGSAYILQKTDSGKHISITSGGVTVPNTIFSTGDTVMVFNNSNSNQTVTQGVNVILKFAATALTGNRTLAGNGVCSILCYSANSFVISGAGLS